MSELIAEARVLVTPDTTAFRTLLATELAAITKTVPPVPVQIAPVLTGTASTAPLVAGQAQLGAAVAGTTTALVGEERALAAVSKQEVVGARASAVSASAAEAEAVARRQAAAATALHARQLGGLSSGAASAGLSLVGLRGATLAASAPFLAGAAGALAFSKAIQSATSFQSQLSVFAATTGATATQMERVSEAARQLGRDITLPGVTAGDAAEAMTEFAKAGLSVNEAMVAARGGLQLATAAQISNAEAVELSANALNAFGLSGSQAVRVADTLANAANLAQGGIQDTALALRQAAGAAAVVGVSFEDTAALLTLLARNGLTGSDAGTALRTAFLRLVNPSKEANKVIRELGINLRDAQGNVRPEVFAEFADAQSGLVAKTQQANAALVFGQDAFRAFGFLGREGTQGLREVQNGLETTGTAARIAGARMTGLTGATANLRNQLDTLGITIGTAATPLLERMVDRLAEVTSGANEAADALGEMRKEFDDLPGPDTGDFFSSFSEGLTTGLENLNPQAAQILKFMEAFREGVEESAENIGDEGADLRSSIEDAGREAALGARDFGDQIVAAFSAMFAAAQDAIDAQAREFRLAIIKSIGQSGGQAAGLDEAFDKIIAAGGSPQQQIGNLQRQAKVQADIIRKAGPDAAGVVLEARRAAQKRLAQINTQIKALEDQIASDQKKAASDQEQSRNKADQALLDSLAGDRTRQQNRIAQAAQTTGAADDIRENLRLQTLIRTQIGIVRAQVIDQKARASAILSLQSALIQVGAALQGLRQTEQQQRQEARQEAFDAQVALAEAEGNDRLRIQLINLRIASINREIALGKVEGAALNRLKTERATLRQQREEIRADQEAAQDAELSARTALAQSIFDLTGNRNPLLKAINAHIAETKKDIAAAKKAGESTVELRTALNNFLLERKRVLEDAEKDAGTTAFELLTQAVGRFGVAGNLIGTAQPFAGPTEFTADLSQFLRRQTVTTTAAKPSASPFAGFQGSADRLVEAINRNTAALNGGEEGPTKRKGTRPPVSGAIDRNDKRWRDADRARAAIEGAG